MAFFIAFARTYLQPRLGDAALRSAIIALYLCGGLSLLRAWPHRWPYIVAEAKNVTYPLLVYAFFFWIMFTVFAPALLSATGSKRVAGSIARMSVSAAITLSKIAIMTIINVIVLTVRVGYAAVSSGSALETCVDAGTHFLEREADLILKPA